jgi:hypothetical protein
LIVLVPVRQIARGRSRQTKAIGDSAKDRCGGVLRAIGEAFCGDRRDDQDRDSHAIAPAFGLGRRCADLQNILFDRRRAAKALF